MVQNVSNAVGVCFALECDALEPRSLNILGCQAYLHVKRDNRTTTSFFFTLEDIFYSVLNIKNSAKT